MDFSRPASPVEVADYIESELRAMAKSKRRHAELLIAHAEGLEAAADQTFHNRMQWERYQPKAADSTTDDRHDEQEG